MPLSSCTQVRGSTRPPRRTTLRLADLQGIHGEGTGFCAAQPFRTLVSGPDAPRGSGRSHLCDASLDPRKPELTGRDDGVLCRHRCNELDLKSVEVLTRDKCKPCTIPGFFLKDSVSS